MEINAYEKIKRTLIDACCDFEYEKFDLLDGTDEKMKQWFLKTMYGSDIIEFQQNNPESKVSAEEYSFFNGLAFFNIKYMFKNDKGNICMKRRFVLMNEDQELVQVLFQSERKPYLNLLKDGQDEKSWIPIGEKTIEIAETQVYINYIYGSYFTTYNNLTDCTLLKEVYTQGNTILSSHDDVNDFELLEQCFLCNSSGLEILYHNSKPSQIQLIDGQDLEEFGYHSDSSEDALKAVVVINQEVDAMVEKIKSLVEDYAKEDKAIQKNIGTISKE